MLAERSGWRYVLLASMVGGVGCPATAQHRVQARPVQKLTCNQAVIEGEVKAGRSFEKVFAKGLDFYLEALPSGWIVRVLPVGVARGTHDYAELATPPYRSVSPLLISTDFSFRAQDAVAWNPRRFRYAQDGTMFQQLSALYAGVMANQPAAMAKVAVLVGVQPEAELQILNATLTPGTADQWQMAAAVASHLETTPLQVEQGVAPSPLGKIVALQFRARLELAPGVQAADGVEQEKIPCTVRPT